ncbi:alpha/beta hydrolase [Coxiella endosymbiont of Amblyomma americanum]|uniref:alpha/beta hydrolase n=1 Tax=Coxiella endosymbiont of Amblyomma americanum TaxID=325775 RepID=UPI00057DE61C|nr:carboxylesterase [Coxiella endosymbiont of Amblyomma americanum]AJC50368.1 carboxylesterase [Coxiella endosymbiont of Amblyomma americanum]AUJ58712.1 carboxylesterase [Coxiella-like endosymbiont of Amblyomma americanum]
MISPKEKIIGSVIWLHGLGADRHSFYDLISQLVLPKDLHLRFIFPNAPIRSVTINNGMRARAWYDIYSLTDFTKEDKNGIMQSQKSINQLIKAEIIQGILSYRVVLAGFSQGGAMALYTGLRYSESLAGIIALSTYLPLVNQITTNEKEGMIYHRKIPIFMAHGNFDPILPITLGRKTYQILSQLGYPVEWHDYIMGHQICRKEIQDIEKWLINLFIDVT